MALIGYTNAVDMPSVELGASSAALGYEAAALRDGRGAPSIAWQTPTYTRDAFLTLTSATPIPWRVAALCRTNLTGAARIRVRVGALASVISAPDYDSGLISAGVQFGVGQALHIMPSAVTADTMNIYVDDLANPDLFLNVPLVYAGAAQEFDISPGSQPDREIRRDDRQSRSGTVTVDPLSQARRWRIEVNFIRESAATWLPAMEAAAGAGRNILFIPRQSSARASAESVLGLLTPGGTGFLGPTGNFRTWTGSIIERL